MPGGSPAILEPEPETGERLDGLEHLHRVPGEQAVWADAVPSPAAAAISTAALAGAVLGQDTGLVYGPEARSFADGKTVLVTGAGGSIGSELVRQFAALGAEVICADRDEYALYRLELAATGRALLTDRNLVLADVTSRPQMAALFAERRPQVVVHAAACKHLPLLEKSPAHGIITNVAGTAVVAALAAEYGAMRFVNISTDKAANPVSVLGMTKRLAEVATTVYGPAGRSASVRFGNVFASRGSFIETLAYQLRAGLPVTVTDPSMTRYFMTIPQAAGLVIEAAVLADGLRTFLLDMGEPYRIADVVRRIAAVLAAGSPEPQVTCTGRRAGEKLAEELAGPGEIPSPAGHPLITAVPAPVGTEVSPLIKEVVQAAAVGTDSDVLLAMLAAAARVTYAEPAMAGGAAGL